MAANLRHSGRGFLMRPLTFGYVLSRCLLLAVVLFLVIVIALKLGAVPVSLYALARDLIRVALHQASELSSDYRLIIFDIRLPRILLGTFVGASLAVAGTSFQALLRNPLADPYVLGLMYGGGVGAMFAILAEPHLPLPSALASMFTPLGAFLGALGTVVAVYFLGRRKGQLDTNTLLLAGV